jgi:hypothetical protein
MAKLSPSGMLALATLGAIAVGLATPAFAMTHDRNRAERSDFIYLPADSNCVGRAWCDLVRY